MEFSKRVGDVLITNDIWDIAKEKIYFFGISNRDSDRIIEPLVLNESIKVIDIFKKRSIIPIEVKKTNDGEIYIRFYRCNNDYSIYIAKSDYKESEVSFLYCFDKKHSFYRRNNEGTVDLDSDIYELLSLQELDEILSEVTIDTFHDFKELIKKIELFEPNWHVNYKVSNSFSRYIIIDSNKILDILEEKRSIPFGVFPIVKDVNGKVAIRFCYFYNEKVCYLDILGNDQIDSNEHDIYGDNFKITSRYLSEYIEKFVE